ncbi:MAG: hypothetical protein H7A46_15175 [Verrucomicrobiales bacterium]|nr:hypothetical protein [Verrucomicrobiales bacterium]
MVAADGRVFAALYGRGLYLWDEFERSWLKRGPVTPLVLAGVGSVLIAGHNPGGLWRTDDLGQSWARGVGAGSVADLLTSLTSDGPDELPLEAPVWELASGEHLAIAGADAGIYLSEDRGRTWTRARTGLPEQSPGIAFLVREEFVLTGVPITGAP